ncbi:hypothetical protein FF011L_34770 [Roseimaritima multifibrata]|uniref:Uncharacterized protein n=1 Tax=Roseimaritima multifibrata TaxID=1930274 RepID=A0A517MIS2_9BACT|nr:hypothetical protein FF011L_34770 [Roseimaritima multifibrata]
MVQRLVNGWMSVRHGDSPGENLWAASAVWLSELTETFLDCRYSDVAFFDV